MNALDADLVIQQYDECDCRLVADKSILKLIQERFSFFAENYKWTPKFKSGFWDGKIKALNMNTRLIHKGLIPEIVEFCQKEKITFSLDDNLFPEKSFNLEDQDILNLYKSIKGPYVPKDYQISAVKHAVNNNRSIILSPTASGKSYFLYGLSRFYVGMKLKVLIVVHRAQLVKQIIEDNFVAEYDSNRGSFTTHVIYSGKDKKSGADITASTWQSIVNMPESFFEGFDVILADEVHAWNAQSCIKIMNMCKHIRYRTGTSGTLQDIEATRMTLSGLFGPAIQVKKTHELIESGDVAPLKIKALVLNYPEADCKLVNKFDYHQEINFIETHDKRNEFLKKLLSKNDGNTLVAFRHKEHGKAIFDMVQGDKFFIDGSVDIEKRGPMCKHMDENTGVTGVVSLGTFAEGINIKNVNRVILACTVKSKIKLLQLIGRGLRVSEVFDHINFIDICDNLRYKKHNNFALIHGLDRYKRYKDEKFEMSITEYNL